MSREKSELVKILLDNFDCIDFDKIADEILNAGYRRPSSTDKNVIEYLKSIAKWEMDGIPCIDLSPQLKNNGDNTIVLTENVCDFLVDLVKRFGKSSTELEPISLRKLYELVGELEDEGIIPRDKTEHQLLRRIAKRFGQKPVSLDVKWPKIEKAHTYGSENADSYLAFDCGQKNMLARCKKAVQEANTSIK